MNSAKKSCNKSSQDKNKFKKRCEKVAKKRIKEADKAAKNSKEDEKKAKKSGDQAKKPGQGGQPQQNPQQDQGKDPETNELAQEPDDKQQEFTPSSIGRAKVVRQASGAKSEYDKLVSSGACSIDHTDCSSEKTKSCGQDSAVLACCTGPSGSEGKNADYCPQELEAIAQRAENGTTRTNASVGGAAISGGSLSKTLDEKIADELKVEAAAAKKKIPQLDSEESGFSGGGGGFSPSSDSFAESSSTDGNSFSDNDPQTGANVKKPVLGQSTRDNFRAMSELICKQYKSGKLIRATGFNSCAVFTSPQN